jgi:hypothetical protein
MKDKRADQPAKILLTPSRIHMLLLLNDRDRKQRIFKNVSKCKMFCIML